MYRMPPPRGVDSEIGCIRVPGQKIGRAFSGYEFGWKTRVLTKGKCKLEASTLQSFPALNIIPAMLYSDQAVEYRSPHFWQWTLL
jgi:hypothetical protein